MARADAEDFFRLIAGGDSDGWLELRHARSQLGPPNLSRWFRVGDVAAAAAFALDTGQGVDVYAGTAPRVRQHGRAADVERGWIVSADADTDAALDRLRAFPLLPSMIVESGGRTASGRAKLHAHLSLVDAADADVLGALKAGLAVALDSDRAVANPAGILRVPGTLNLKPGAGPVRTVALNDRAYTADEISGALDGAAPLVRDYTPRGRIDGADWLAAQDDGIKRIAPPAYVRALTGLDVPDRGGKVSCPLPGHDDRDPSCHVYRDPWEGWYCYGCRRGGTVYDLAAHLWGVPTPLRDDAYFAVRKYLVRVLAADLVAS